MATDLHSRAALMSDSGGTVEVKREYLEVLVYPWLAEEEGRFIEARDHVRVLLESGRHE